jgi:menaquinone-specific isochorismate synthase
MTAAGRSITPEIAPRLQARTVALSEVPDLLDVAGDNGLLWRDEHGGLAAHGTALRLELPHGLADWDTVHAVGQALQAIPSEDEVGLPGCGPVALGALPFDPAAPGWLVVPHRIVGRHGGRGWVTTVTPTPPNRVGGPIDSAATALEQAAGSGSSTGPAAAAGTIHSAAPAVEQAFGRRLSSAGLDLSLGRRAEPPDEFTLTPSLPHAEWKAIIAAAIEQIEAEEFAKVVLARRVDIAANRPFVIADVLSRLVALYPSCMVFSVDGFIGASPELLISRRGDQVTSNPLAGTVARSGDAHSDQALVAALMADPKARREHQVVVDALRDALSPVCSSLAVPAQPSVMGLRNVSHLSTRITARLAPATAETALELAARVHPTPAVGGNPTTPALRYLQKVEGFDRGRYAGPVGWVDARGDGAWAVGIRCAEVDGAHARIFAGNGVVAGSDPADELAETQLKFQALLAALVRP